MKDGLIITLLSIIPKKPTARLMGYSARLRLPSFLNRALLRAFVWKYKINMEESTSTLEDFSCLSDLFLRTLKPGVRTISEEENISVSPVDGTIHSFGSIEDGLFQQAKDMFGSVETLFGDQDSFLSSEKYKNGSYMIIYLSPQDYHRVHAHTEGTLTKLRYMPGRLWPVFPAATRSIQSLFDKNERLLFSFDTKDDSQILAMIGAFGVGRMTSPFCDIVTNTNTEQKNVSQNIEIKRAAEIGAFALGSTVILLWTHRNMEWMVASGQPIQLGSPILRH
jgi:phosphatidylserine decarboxylase